MIFSKRHNFLARFLLISAVALATAPIFSESVEEKNLEANSFFPTEELLSEELKSIHQEEVNSVLADGISYSQEERLSDFPDMDSLLREESGAKKIASASRISKKKNETLVTVTPNSVSRFQGSPDEMQSSENSTLSAAQSACGIYFVFEQKVQAFDPADQLGSALPVKSENPTRNSHSIFSGIHPFVFALAQERFAACAFGPLGLSVSGQESLLCRTETTAGRLQDDRSGASLLAAVLKGQARAVVGTPQQRAGSHMASLQKNPSALPGAALETERSSMVPDGAAIPRERGTNRVDGSSENNSPLVDSENFLPSPNAHRQKESRGLSYIFLSFPEPVKF